MSEGARAPRETWGVRAYRTVLARCPIEFRLRYEDEMAMALASLLAAERSRGGRLAEARLWGRAMADGMKTARREQAQHGRPGSSSLLAGALDDLKYVVRSWRGAKAFALTSIATIGLGLGLNAGIFAFADGYLFRPLPFDDAGRLYNVREKGTYTGGVALDDLDAIQTHGAGLAGLAQWDPGGRAGGRVKIADRWQNVLGYQVSPDFTDVMGFRLFLGRPFRVDEHRDGTPAPCWLSYRFWQSAFGGDPQVVGRRFRAASLREIEVVGVMPPLVATFDLNNAPPDLVFPAVAVTYPPARRAAITPFPIARLRVGVSQKQAEDRLQAIVNQVAGLQPDGRPRRTIYLSSLREDLVRGGRATALLLFALSLLVMLLVVVNFGHLLLARMISRVNEISVRQALGASRWRIARLLLAESLAVTGGGLALGLVLGWVLSSVVQAHVPVYPTGNRNMSLVPMRFDHRVVAFSALLALVVAIAAGLFPVWRQSRSKTLSLARTSGAVPKSVSGRPARVILSVEVATATVVMIGALLVGASAWVFLNQPLGFDPESRYTVMITFPRSAVPTPEAVLAAKQQFVAGMRQLSGVRALGFGGGPSGSAATVEVAGRGFEMNAVYATRIDAGFIPALGIRVLAGRAFSAAESESDAPVALVDERAARLLWPGQDPIGQTVRDTGGQDRTVWGARPLPDGD